MDRNQAENLLMDFCYIWEQRIKMHRKEVYDEDIVKEYIIAKNKILDAMTESERWER